MKTEEGFYEDDMNIIIEALAFQIDFDTSLKKRDLKKRYAIIEVIDRMLDGDRKRSLIQKYLEHLQDGW